MLKSFKPIRLLKVILVFLLVNLISVGIWGSTMPVANAAIFSFAGDRPSNLGLQAGQFAPCASTPNCVSSQAQDEAHRIAPIQYQGDATATWAKLKQLITSNPNAKIISETENYLYAEFTSKLMGFVDDVEFSLGQAEIQLRSASRLGESDLGVNRQRIEAIRSQL
jgi:uncharacterized protein (DUF1499 family)